MCFYSEVLPAKHKSKTELKCNLENMFSEAQDF